MANTFKLKTKNNVGVTTSDVYVVPASTTTVVIGVTLANTSGQSINVGVGITRAAADDVNILRRFLYHMVQVLNSCKATK